MVGGRTVEVDLALSQDDARNLASGGRATGAGKDNRNLYLVGFLSEPLSSNNAEEPHTSAAGQHIAQASSGSSDY